MGRSARHGQRARTKNDPVRSSAESGLFVGHRRARALKLITARQPYAKCMLIEVI
jgi:hypothetical protein